MPNYLFKYYAVGLISACFLFLFFIKIEQLIAKFLHYCEWSYLDKHYFYNFLVTGLVAFDERLGSFNNTELHVDSRSSRLISSAATINSCILKTDNGPQLWKKFDTPIYSKLKNAHQYLER